MKGLMLWTKDNLGNYVSVWKKREKKVGDVHKFHAVGSTCIRSTIYMKHDAPSLTWKADGVGCLTDQNQTKKKASACLFFVCISQLLVSGLFVSLSRCTGRPQWSSWRSGQKGLARTS